MFSYEGIAIHWLGHDGYRFEAGPLSVVVDPFKLEGAKPATLVLVTHEHFDHCSVEDLQKVVNEQTIIIAPNECMSALGKVKPGEVIPMRPGQTQKAAGITVTAVPAYNIDKYRDKATKTVFHPREDEKVGYLLDMGGVRIYHAGDTDQIPEMGKIECDIALLPVSGTYVMTAEEAAEAAKRIKPKIAIPMHYGSIIGKEDDAARFKKLLEGSEIEVEILRPR